MSSVKLQTLQTYYDIEIALKNVQKNKCNDLEQIDPYLNEKPRFESTDWKVVNLVKEIFTVVFYNIKQFVYRMEISQINAGLKGLEKQIGLVQSKQKEVLASLRGSQSTENTKTKARRSKRKKSKPPQRSTETEESPPNQPVRIGGRHILQAAAMPSLFDTNVEKDILELQTYLVDETISELRSNRQIEASQLHAFLHFHEKTTPNCENVIIAPGNIEEFQEQLKEAWDQLKGKSGPIKLNVVLKTGSAEGHFLGIQIVRAPDSSIKVFIINSIGVSSPYGQEGSLQLSEDEFIKAIREITTSSPERPLNVEEVNTLHQDGINAERRTDNLHCGVLQYSYTVATDQYLKTSGDKFTSEGFLDALGHQKPLPQGFCEDQRQQMANLLEIARKNPNTIQASILTTPLSEGSVNEDLYQETYIYLLRQKEYFLLPFDENRRLPEVSFTQTNTFKMQQDALLKSIRRRERAAASQVKEEKKS